MPRAHVVPDGNKLAALRGEADLTQLELARQAGYGLRTIGKIENGQPTGARTLAAAATVLSRRLGRAVTLADLTKRPNGAANGARTMTEDATRLVQEMVRFLDLSDLAAQRPSTGLSRAGRALLVDHFRLRGLPARHLCFPYSSLGEQTYGECLSHPGQCHWQEADELPAWNGKPRRGYRLRVEVAPAALAHVPVICNGVEYLGAFGGESGDVLEVPVLWPTEDLTIMVLFPPARRCRSARGRPDGTPTQPVIMPGGKLLHWRISAPPAGTTYRLEWEW
jgi:transcriptional regulator with XRE-family HTH domain